jgi:hypothetical protein
MASSYIEQAIMYDLKSSTAVHDKVGDRIFFALAEQDATKPYCVYSVISDPHTPQSFDSSDTGQARVQINVIDDNRFDALKAADAIRDRLDKYSSTMDSMTIYSLNCSGILTFPLAEEEGIYQATFDALVRYKDA